MSFWWTELDPRIRLILSSSSSSSSTNFNESSLRYAKFKLGSAYFQPYVQPSKKLQSNGMADMRPLTNLHELDHRERNQGWGRRQKWVGPEKNNRDKATKKKTKWCNKQRWFKKLRKWCQHIGLQFSSQSYTSLLGISQKNHIFQLKKLRRKWWRIINLSKQLTAKK